MQSSTLSRRGFFHLAAGSVFYAMAARPLLAGVRGKPDLRLGVLSDIHLNEKNLKSAKGDANEYGGGYRGTFRAALEYFRDRHVDAVIIAGDLADTGSPYELQQVGLVWQEVFPNDRLPDGAHVEKVFVYGNHDISGWNYVLKRKKLDKEALAAARKAAKESAIVKNRAAAWKEAFGEEYKNVYHKTVKGYTFLCAHWGFEKRLAGYIRKHASELELAGSRPFFCVQHPNLKDTLFTYWGLKGCDKGDMTAALKPYPWAVSFSGHSHMALTDDRSIWQGAFTALNTSTLKRICEPYGREWQCVNSRKMPEDKPRHMQVTSRRGRQGMVVDVYPDHLEVNRREFTLGTDAGPTLAVPLPANEGNPNGYGYAAQKIRAGKPQFPTVARAKAERRTGKNELKKTEEQIVLSFPSAIARGERGRVLLYRIAATDAKGSELGSWQVAQEEHFHPVARIPKAMQLVIGADEVASGAPVHFKITPVGFFRQEGRPLTCVLG